MFGINVISDISQFDSCVHNPVYTTYPPSSVFFRYRVMFKHKITELSVRSIDIIDFKPQMTPTNNVKAEVNDVEIRVNGDAPSIIQFVSDEDLPF